MAITRLLYFTMGKRELRALSFRTSPSARVKGLKVMEEKARDKRVRAKGPKDAEEDQQRKFIGLKRLPP